MESSSYDDNYLAKDTTRLIEDAIQHENGDVTNIQGEAEVMAASDIACTKRILM